MTVHVFLLCHENNHRALGGCYSLRYFCIFLDHFWSGPALPEEKLRYWLSQSRTNATFKTAQGYKYVQPDSTVTVAAPSGEAPH